MSDSNHGMSAPGDPSLRTARTPGTASAFDVSTRRTMACACGHVNTATCSMSGSATSEGKTADPLTRSYASTRVSGLPTTFVSPHGAGALDG